MSDQWLCNKFQNQANVLRSTPNDRGLDEWIAELIRTVRPAKIAVAHKVWAIYCDPQPKESDDE